MLSVMTVEEVADTYPVAASTVRGSIHKGYIAARKSGKNWLIRRADAEARWGGKVRSLALLVVSMGLTAALWTGFFA